jgi:hypothetical protein
VGKRSQREIRETLDEVRRAHEQLSDKPDRQREAEGHIRQLEHLLIHGETHKGNPNLSANAIVRRARGFLFEWEDHGFLHDTD